MSAPLATLPADAKRAHRNVIAKWAQELILDLGTQVAASVRNDPLYVSGSPDEYVPKLEDYARARVTDKELASIEHDGEGDPNPVLITDKALEQVVGGVLVFLRGYVVEVATVELAKSMACAVLDVGRFETDEGKGLQLEKPRLNL